MTVHRVINITALSGSINIEQCVPGIDAPHPTPYAHHLHLQLRLVEVYSTLQVYGVYNSAGTIHARPPFCPFSPVFLFYFYSFFVSLFSNNTTAGLSGREKRLE